MTTCVPLNYTEAFFIAKQQINQVQDNIICQLKIGADVDLERLCNSFHATLEEIDILWVNLETMPGHMTAVSKTCQINRDCVKLLDEITTEAELEQLKQHAMRMPLLQTAPHIHLSIVPYQNSYILLLAAPHMLMDGIANYLLLSSWFKHYGKQSKPQESFKLPVFKQTTNIYKDYQEFLPELKTYYKDSKLLHVPDFAFDDTALAKKSFHLLPLEFEDDLKALAKKHGTSFEMILLSVIAKTIREVLANKEFGLRYNRHGRREASQRNAFRFLLEDPVLKIDTQHHALPHLIQQIETSLEYFGSKAKVPYFMPQSIIMETYFPALKPDIDTFMKSLNLPPSVYVQPDVMTDYGYFLKNIQEPIKPPEQILVHVNITPSIFLAKQYAAKAEKVGINLQSISFDFNHAKYRELHIFFTKDVDNHWRLLAKGPIKHAIMNDMVQMILGEIRSECSNVILEASKPHTGELPARAG